MRIFKILFYLGIMGVGVMFSVLNARPVTLDLYVKSIQMPLPLLLTITFVLGSIIGWLIAFVRAWRLKRDIVK